MAYSKNLKNFKYISLQFISDLKKDIMNKSKNFDHNLLFISSLPKSGSTLIENIASILQYVDLKSSFFWKFNSEGAPKPHGITTNMIRSAPNEKLSYLKTHTEYSKEYTKILKLNRTKVIITYRDLRDVMLSRYFHIMSDKFHWQHNSISELNFKDGFLESIECKNSSHPIKNFNNIHYYYYWIKNWKKEYQNYGYLMLKYEDYILNRTKFIEKILSYLNINETTAAIVECKLDQRLRSVKKIKFEDRLKLPGDFKSTYRNGGINNWQYMFDEEISKRFFNLLPEPIDKIL